MEAMEKMQTYNQILFCVIFYIAMKIWSKMQFSIDLGSIMVTYFF